MCAAVLALAAAGCSGIGRPEAGFSVRSLSDDPLVLRSSFATAVYSHDPSRGTSFILSDIPAANLLSGEFDEGQVVHLELLWVPKPGRTPLDRTATNATIRHVIFSGGQVGIYGGAGFVMPRGKLGRSTARLEVREASLSLLEATPGFMDLLSPAEVTGTISADLDRDTTRRLYFSVSQRVTDALGYSRFVRSGSELPGLAAVLDRAGD